MALRRSSSLHAREMSVRNLPGMIAFTRTFGAYSRANASVTALSAAFAPA